MLKLCGHDASPYVRRVRVVLAELRIPFERDTHGWQDPAAEFVDASPIQRVPMLPVAAFTVMAIVSGRDGEDEMV